MSILHQINSTSSIGCPQPSMIRVLVHPSKKIVLLGGEWHTYFEKVGTGRTSDSLYFQLLSDLTKKIALNTDNESPFHKVLLLSEQNTNSGAIELFGGAYEKDLFQEVNQVPLLKEATRQMMKIAKRYPSKALYRGIDIRTTLRATSFVIYFLYAKVIPNVEKPSTESMDKLIRTVFALINLDIDLEGYNNTEVEKETNMFLEKLEASEKKISKTFNYVKNELEGLKSYFLRFVQSISEQNEQGDIIIKPAPENEFQQYYRPLMYTLSFLMDIYTVSFIVRMPPKTLSVFFAGMHHTEKVFNVLCTLHGYKLLETELTFSPPLNPCHVIFPETSQGTISLIESYNKRTKEVYEKFIQANEKNKKRFIINLITYRNVNTDFISLPLASFKTAPQNLTLKYFGTYAQFIESPENQDKLFNSFISWSIQ
jgi:hypothetical protein